MLSIYHTQLSLPEIGHSSSWKLPWAEPRTRCGWDWWAPVPPLPSTLWPKAGTKDSTVLTGSHPPQPVEPRDKLPMMGRERGGSTPQRSHPHPSGLGDPSEELACSLEVARSSGPAWHSQVWDGYDQMAENSSQNFSCPCVFLVPFSFREPSPSSWLSPCCTFFFLQFVWLSILVSVWRNRAVPLDVPQTHDVSTQPKAQRRSALQRVEADWLTHPPTHHTKLSLKYEHTHQAGWSKFSSFLSPSSLSLSPSL